MLEFRQASFSVGRTALLKPLSIGIKAAQLTVICGPNGAGKSTFLKMLSGELKPSVGQVLHDGVALSELRPMDMACRRAVLAQAVHVAFPFTVIEVVRLGFTAARLKPAARDAMAMAMLDQVELSGFAGRFYHELSGGERQCVQFARVLCQFLSTMETDNTHFLLLDEPIASLDIKHQLQLLDIARKLVGPATGVVAVLHDLNVAALYGDRIVILNEGSCMADGDPGETITNRTMQDVFGVDLCINTTPGDNTPFVLPARP